MRKMVFFFALTFPLLAGAPVALCVEDAVQPSPMKAGLSNAQIVEKLFDKMIYHEQRDASNFGPPLAMIFDSTINGAFPGNIKNPFLVKLKSSRSIFIELQIDSYGTIRSALSRLKEQNGRSSRLADDAAFLLAKGLPFSKERAYLQLERYVGPYDAAGRPNNWSPEIYIKLLEQLSKNTLRDVLRILQENGTDPSLENIEIELDLWYLDFGETGKMIHTSVAKAIYDPQQDKIIFSSY
jgi:hypothetical protein